jgi:small subunit ribosomal protein S18
MMTGNKQCYFCNNNVKQVDYKEVEALKKFLDPHAKMVPHRRTNICAVHQRKLATAVKRARFLGLLPFVAR